MRSKPWILTIVCLGVLGLAPGAWAAVVLGPLDADFACGTGPSDDRQGDPSPLVIDRQGSLFSEAALPTGSMGGSLNHFGGGSVNAVAFVHQVLSPAVTPLVSRVVEPLLMISEGLRAGIFRPPRL